MYTTSYVSQLTTVTHCAREISSLIDFLVSSCPRAMLKKKNCLDARGESEAISVATSSDE